MQKISFISNKNMTTIIRQSYIDKIEKYLGKEIIIVLVGQRRVGKSCMMKMIRDRKKADDCNNIIFIDKEKREFDCIQTYQDLNDYIGEHFLSDKHNYILIDEIQDIREFERSIRSYRTEPNTDIIITGSNARMQSNELSTLIGGRYKEIYIQSLSYNEFLEFHKLSDNDEALALYIQYGGLPGLAKIGLEEDDAREYQMDIYHTVLLKDVIMRNQIRNVPFLENLVRFLADNTGKLISANSRATSAQHLICVRTTAVVRFMKATVPKTDIISSNNYHYILRQLLILFSITYPITYDRLSYYLQQLNLLLTTTYDTCRN